MDKDKPCFFWINEEEIIVAICEKCQGIHKKENAWFWKDGYGDFDVNCHICNCFIKNINPERK